MRPRSSLNPTTTILAADGVTEQEWSIDLVKPTKPTLATLTMPYVAGMFDTSGHVFITNQPRSTTPMLRLALGLPSPVYVKALIELAPAQVVENGARMRWNSPSDIDKVLKTILPYVVAKRKLFLHCLHYLVVQERRGKLVDDREDYFDTKPVDKLINEFTNQLDVLADQIEVLEGRKPCHVDKRVGRN